MTEISDADATKVAQEVMRLLKEEKVRVPDHLQPVLGETLSRDNLLRSTLLRVQFVLDELRQLTEPRPPEPQEPDPEPDDVPPTPPTELRVDDVTRTSLSASWGPATDNVAVSHYEISVDGQIAANAIHGPNGGSLHLANLVNPEEDVFVRVVAVRAVDTSGNASSPVRIEVPLPSRDVDPEEPEPGENPWPEIGTVGFLGDESALTPMRASAIRTAGTVIENRRIDCSDGELGIHAKNVIIRNCILDCGVWGVYAYNGEAEGLVIEDCTFIGGYQAGVGLEQLEGWEIRRCDFHSGRDAIKPGGRGVVEDCTMHDPDTGGDAHNDCMQFSNCDGVLVRRNNMQGADTSCIAMFENQGTFRNVTIQDNLLTGAGYLIYAGGSTGSGIRVIDNVLDDWGWGPVTDWESKPGNEWSGNVARDGAVVRP